MNESNYYRANEDLRFKLTTPEEEKKLFLAAKAGDAAAREFLVRNHLLFAARYARRKNRGQLPDDEVISAVNAALMNAIDRFDPERGNRFTRYLMPFLKGAIAGLWKSKNIVSPSSHSEKFPGYVTYQEEEREEVASGETPLPAKIKRDMRAYAAEMAKPTDEVVMEAEELTLNLDMLRKCKARLTAAEKTLLRLIYQDKVSMADIARQRKVSRQAIHASHGQIIAKLREAFKRAAK